jgi:hypothetical protein
MEATSHGPARNAPILSTALLALTLTLAAWSPYASAASHAPGAWQYEWRPGWLPGDPETEDALLPPVWARPSGRAAVAGLFIALDPVTHLPTTPSDAQIRSFATQVSHDALLAPARPLQVERLPGGGEIVHLNGQFQVYSVVRRDAKGRMVTECAPDPATARKLLAQPAPADKSTWEVK